MPSLQKCVVGPLVRLRISPILYALVRRPRVLAATCGRTAILRIRSLFRQSLQKYCEQSCCLWQKREGKPSSQEDLGTQSMVTTIAMLCFNRDYVTSISDAPPLHRGTSLSGPP